MHGSRALGAAVWILTQGGALLAQGPRVIDVRPDRAPSIAQAIRAARPGDRIVLARGVYREPTIVVDRSLTITGKPGAILDGGGATHILRIEADRVTVRGIGLRNVTPSHVEDRAAIRVGEVRGCRIEDNRITDAFFGVYLAGTVGCVIARNEIHATPRSEESSGNGIHLWTARDIRITDNRVSGHRDGIYLEFAHDAVVSGNDSQGNVRYGLHFMYADDCRYERNLFRGNQAGVAVMYTRRVAMVDNRFEDNWGPSSYGLLLKEIYDSELTGNTFARNTTGLFADGATRMQARRNVFADNGWAVKLMASTQDAELTGNVFLRNTFDVASNSRGGSALLLGNYWDEYRGYDLDRDGRGDVAHRPVRLFSLVVERNGPTMALLRSPLVAILDHAERVVPSLTPATLQDAAPLMRRPR